MRIGAFLLLGLTLALPASAQNPPAASDSVTVTSGKLREAVDSFVKSAATPSRITGKTARWEKPICPYVVGVQREAIAYLTRRIKEIAAEVGAPVSKQENCRPNISVIFNTAPDTLMEDVRKHMPWVLGYYDNGDERDRLAVMDHSIQAWYRTATRDVRGQLNIDKQEIFAKRRDINPSKLNDGLQPEMFGVLIVANPDLLKGDYVETVGDYITMLALAQMQSPDTCQALPSVTNFLARDCAHKAEGLTLNDLGYLRGVYDANSGLAAHLQRHDIANRMEKALEGQ